MPDWLLICFQDAKKLLCSTHKKDNLQRKLKTDFVARDAAVSHVLADIFGRSQGAIRENGLIDSMERDDFDGKLMQLKATWDCLVPGFHQWFVDYEADIFKLHLIRGITKSALLDGHFTNNQTESINNNVKNWLGRTGNLSFAVANSKLDELVRAQGQEFEISVYGNGSYELAEGYETLRKKRHIWNAMGSEERRNSLLSFWKSPLNLTRRTSPTPTHPTQEECPSLLVHHESSTEHHKVSLSLSLENFELDGCSSDLLKEIEENAEKLIASENGIVNAPGYDGVFVQHNAERGSSNVPPHMITWTKAGKYVCDCKLYTSLKICEHAVSVADSKGKLKDFVEWRKKEKVSTCLTDLVMSDITSGRKGKVLKPRRGGRTPLNKETAIVHREREPLMEDKSIDETLSALDEIEKDSPFELIYLFQTKAKLCYGCGEKYDRSKEANSLIVRKHCEREFTVQGVKKTKFQFAYFHLKKNCITKKCSEYKKEMLKMSSESKGILPEEVKGKLRRMGISVE
ncbi:hypothetical protein FSP39_011070 [Pinctada imbricata]|uniref:SWIM-type domain-containing protein n=1 Tax=Pinctada imbricata TaxID=66713 RepID=A0AA89BR02_PINIB|nr:hypothetical protein FSP39_011070 [Pinctada imbricata]